MSSYRQKMLPGLTPAGSNETANDAWRYTCYELFVEMNDDELEEAIEALPLYLIGDVADRMRKLDIDDRRRNRELFGGLE